jgi:hypothetical protein
MELLHIFIFYLSSVWLTNKDRNNNRQLRHFANTDPILLHVSAHVQDHRQDERLPKKSFHVKYMVFYLENFFSNFSLMTAPYISRNM